MAFLRDRASLSRRASLCVSAALRGVAPSVHEPRDPMPSQHNLFCIHHSSYISHQPECLRVLIITTNVTCHLTNMHLAFSSPIMSPIRPLSQELTQGLTYTTLTGPFSSSSPAIPADRQNRTGKRRFTSLVTSTLMSSKRARMGNDLMDLGLFLNDSSTTPSTSVFELQDDDADVVAALGPRVMDLDPSPSLGTSRATCNLHSRPGWTGTSRNEWRRLWSVR